MYSGLNTSKDGKKTGMLATEIFVVLLWLMLFINLFNYGSSREFFLNLAVLVFALVFGYFLIRSSAKEVKQREEFELLTKELVAANEELKKLDRVKSDFVSIVSHQFRSPLSTMKGYLSMAIEGNFGKLSIGLFEKLQRVYEANERLIRLVGDLLNLSRIEQGKIQYTFSDVDIRKVFLSVLEDLRATIKGRGFIVVVSIEKDLPSISGDEGKLRQVFANLVDNAIHYTPAGSGTITIDASKNDTKNTICISVQDTGIGMSQEDLANLFLQFSRGEGAAQYYTEGLGLGLYVAKHVVDAHGGKIWAESRGKGKGSTFFVELPLNQESLKFKNQNSK